MCNVSVLSPCFVGSNVILENCSIGPNVTIGNNCTIRNATLKNCVLWDDEIVCGADVENQIIMRWEKVVFIYWIFWACARVIGGVNIGNNLTIGAEAVIVKNVLDNVVVVDDNNMV